MFLELLSCENSQNTKIESSDKVLDAKVWELISFPSQKFKIGSRFGDKDSIRLFTNNGSWKEIDSLDTIYPGYGYYFKCRNRTTLSTSDFIEFSAESLVIHLDSGINTLGNPYSTEINIPDSKFVYLSYSSLDSNENIIYDTLHDRILVWQGFEIHTTTSYDSLLPLCA